MYADDNHKKLANSNALYAVCEPARIVAKKKKNRKTAYRPHLNLFAELIHTPSQVPTLIDIEKQCFPTLMQDESRNFEEFIHDEYCSGLILYKNGIPIGYMMGSHIHEDNSKLALETEPFIRKNQDKIFYISSLAIIEEARSPDILGFLIYEMSELLKSIDYKYFVAYVRKRHGLSRLLRQRLAASILHTVDNWEETGEPFDYCLVNLDSIPSLPIWADLVLHWIRSAKHKQEQKRIKT